MGSLIRFNGVSRGRTGIQYRIPMIRASDRRGLISRMARQYIAMMKLVSCPQNSTNSLDCARATHPPEDIGYRHTFLDLLEQFFCMALCIKNLSKNDITEV